MPKASVDLIVAIRTTADKIFSSRKYQWGHMGYCNCGLLAQEITRITPSEIHQWALDKPGDWNEQCNLYCPTSGLPMDTLITRLLNYGLDIDDLKNLENLSDWKVLQQLPQANRYLRRNNREDVGLYLRTWASLLEEQLLSEIILPPLEQPSVVTLST